MLLNSIPLIKPVNILCYWSIANGQCKTYLQERTIIWNEVTVDYTNLCSEDLNSALSMEMIYSNRHYLTQPWNSTIYANESLQLTPKQDYQHKWLTPTDTTYSKTGISTQMTYSNRHYLTNTLNRTIYANESLQPTPKQDYQHDLLQHTTYPKTGISTKITYSNRHYLTHPKTGLYTQLISSNRHNLTYPKTGL